MTNSSPKLYRCPLCQQPLAEYSQPNTHSANLRCDNQHQFDRAKEGYYHLLPVQFKHSKNPGDAASMVQARRRFLDAGFYKFLQQGVCEQLSKLLSKHENSAPKALLDLGCGEGYYTKAAADTWQKSCSENAIYGVDIAKPAIKYAAKRAENIHYCVASNKQLPFADKQFFTAIKIFAPHDSTELQRLIADGGYVISVSPGPKHLCEVKAAIYDEVRLHGKEAISEGFTLHDSIALTQQQTLTGDSLIDLLMMTPLAWRMSDEDKQRFAAVQRDITFDFAVNIWQKES